MPDASKQRFHGNRYNSMKIGLRGLAFTVNPQHEPKACRELSTLMEKILAEYPEEYFAVAKQQQKGAEGGENDDDDKKEQQQVEEEEDVADQEENDNNDPDDDNNEQEHDESSDNKNNNNNASSGSTFADELKAELEGLSNNRRQQQQQQNEDNNNENPEQRQQRQKRPPRPPRRFRIIDTNCKGFVFVSINFNEEFENEDRFNEQQRQQKDKEQLFNFCAGQAAAMILDISKKVVNAVVTADVPVLRFTYYLYPCLSTAAPTVHSAAVLAEATKIHVPIPQGKSAAKIETHFNVKNNSGVSNAVVLNEIKKGFQERLPMSKYFVTNQSGGSYRRQRQEQQQRVLNASISYLVLHSAALLCIQPDYTELKEYALHKMGVSFADSLSG